MPDSKSPLEMSNEKQLTYLEHVSLPDIDGYDFV